MENSFKLDYFINNLSVTWEKRIISIVTCVLVYLIWKWCDRSQYGINQQSAPNITG